MKIIDSFLNHITMYRLVLWYLGLLVAVAIVLGKFGILPYSPQALMFSTGVLLTVCFLANRIFAWAFSAVPGTDSSSITALILALILPPVFLPDYGGILFLVVAGVWAMGIKYLFTIRKKHIFNPAAFAVALAALTTGHVATWWVGGNLPLLPVVLIGGLLIVRKIKRFDVFIAFSVAAFVTVAVTSLAHPLTALSTTLLHSSFFFLGLVMLTEPLTLPSSRWARVLYGGLVGILFAPAVHIGSFYFSPELALLVGNVLAFALSSSGRFELRLMSRTKVAEGVYELAFSSNRKLPFVAGQYLEFTVGHDAHDSRGNRRYFTIASAPSAKEIRIGVKFYEPMSSFKQALLRLKPGDAVFATSLGGDFVLPKNEDTKVAFIAGGIGITPFRSMVEGMLASKSKRSAVLLYSNKKSAEVAYSDIFERARVELGMKTVYALTNEPLGQGYYAGMITPALIQQEVPDFRDRIFYISGPLGMVDAFKKSLRELGLPSSSIRTDYFPGFA